MVPKSFFLLPGHSLDDFPIHLAGAEAANLLATWTVAWHPAVISNGNGPVSLMRAGIDLPDEKDSILFIPEVSKRYLDDLFFKNVADHQVRLIQATRLAGSRSELLADMFEIVPEFGIANRQIPLEIVNDFFALSYAYLQVQVMTRQLRYSSNLNEERFSKLLLSAAQKACGGEIEACCKDLTTCFDLLMDERSCYYPIQPQLVDIVLLADTTLKTSLSQQLESLHPLNLALTGKTAELLSSANHKAVDVIKQRLSESRISLIGGLQMELPEPLLSGDSSLRQLRLGRQTMTEVFSSAPRVFARRRSGLTPFLPTLLEQLQFAGAVHASFDGNLVPAGSSSNVRWTGIDDGAIPASALPITDAFEAGNFLGLGRVVGQQLDSAHTAVVLFAHWPNRSSESFQDLLNIRKYAPVLGEFVTIEEYFESIYDPGFGDHFEHSDYHHSFLQQMVDGRFYNPISRFVDYWNRHYQLLQCRSLLVQLALMFRQDSSLKGSAQALPAFLAEIESLEQRLDEEVDSRESSVSGLQAEIDLLANRMLVTGSFRLQDSSHSPETASVGKLYAFNTLNFKRRTRLVPSLPAIQPQKENGPIRFADRLIPNSDQHGSGKSESILVIEMVGNSVVRLPSASSNSAPFRDDPDLIEGLTLKNEFLLIEIDPQTGGIKSLMTHNKRNNLVSQQLAARLPATGRPETNPTTTARYTEMVASDIEPLIHSKIEASIRSKGKLLDGETVVAKFQQTVTVTRGLPTVEVEVEFSFPQPWPANRNQYLCSRLAWRDENSQLNANLQEANLSTSGEWISGTQFIHIPQEEHGLTLLTGGLPFHRRSARRMLDTLLVVGNEQSRNFRFGLGLNLPYPMLTAASRSTPVLLVCCDAELSDQLSNWNFHFDRKNILVTGWEPEFDDNSNLTSVQIRCRETEGRAGELTISLPNPITSASQVNFEGAFLRSLRLDPEKPNQVGINLGHYEQIQVKIVL